MSLKANVKQKLMQCFIHKCDREYDRTYQYAQKQMSYGNLIGKWEKANLSKQVEFDLKYTSYVYDWQQGVDLRELSALAKQADVVLLCEQNVYLHKEAISQILSVVKESPDTNIWYGDEDVIDDLGNRSHPWFKPNWSPILFLTVHYLGGLVAVRGTFLRKVLETMLADGEGKEVKPRLFFYHLCKAAGGFNLRTEGICHIDALLCHQPKETSYEKFFACESLMETECHHGASKERPLVSVIIPSKDQEQILMQNLKSLERTTKAGDVEVVIVDNGSDVETKENIEKLICDLTITVKYLYQPMEFNFSAMCNIGAKNAKGSFLLFLNDDIEAIEEGWIDKLTEVARKEYVGCVGTKLLYPNSTQIQHIGVMNLPEGPIHKLQFLKDEESHYFGKNLQDGEVLAVTGACLMVRAELFFAVGGFDEELTVTFNDIDLCYKMYANGYYNVCLNSVRLYHHESLSRGMDISDEKKQRLYKEREKLWQRHSGLKGRDPFYHALLHREGSDTHIRPALEEHLSELKQDCTVAVWREGIWKDFRRHEGVLCGIDQRKEPFLKGYIVMLGDDNACYENRLVFKHKESEAMYWCKLDRVLREDLERNLADQKNVALCGFDIRLTGLQPGEYELIAVAHNKISRVSYWKETGTTVSLTEE
ncbi:MAG: glycosyltransferase [Lachnospiraceae bacterium]|nr:glycosyltransferase [Lachnospiraceae bacterium]